MSLLLASIDNVLNLLDSENYFYTRVASGGDYSKINLLQEGYAWPLEKGSGKKTIGEGDKKLHWSGKSWLPNDLMMGVANIKDGGPKIELDAEKEKILFEKLEMIEGSLKFDSLEKAINKIYIPYLNDLKNIEPNSDKFKEEQKFMAESLDKVMSLFVNKSQRTLNTMTKFLNEMSKVVDEKQLKNIKINLMQNPSQYAFQKKMEKMFGHKAMNPTKDSPIKSLASASNRNWIIDNIVKKVSLGDIRTFEKKMSEAPLTEDVRDELSAALLFRGTGLKGLMAYLTRYDSADMKDFREQVDEKKKERRIDRVLKKDVKKDNKEVMQSIKPILDFVKKVKKKLPKQYEGSVFEYTEKLLETLKEYASSSIPNDDFLIEFENIISGDQGLAKSWKAVQERASLKELVAKLEKLIEKKEEDLARSEEDLDNATTDKAREKNFRRVQKFTNELRPLKNDYMKAKAQLDEYNNLKLPEYQKMISKLPKLLKEIFGKPIKIELRRKRKDEGIETDEDFAKRVDKMDSRFEFYKKNPNAPKYMKSLADLRKSIPKVSESDKKLVDELLKEMDSVLDWDDTFNEEELKEMRKERLKLKKEINLKEIERMEGVSEEAEEYKKLFKKHLDYKSDKEALAYKLKVMMDKGEDQSKIKKIKSDINSITKNMEDNYKELLKVKEDLPYSFIRRYDLMERKQELSGEIKKLRRLVKITEKQKNNKELSQTKRDDSSEEQKSYQNQLDKLISRRDKVNKDLDRITDSKTFKRDLINKRYLDSESNKVWDSTKGKLKKKWKSIAPDSELKEEYEQKLKDAIDKELQTDEEDARRKEIMTSKEYIEADDDRRKFLLNKYLKEFYDRRIKKFEEKMDKEKNILKDEIKNMRDKKESSIKREFKQAPEKIKQAEQDIAQMKEKIKNNEGSKDKIEKQIKVKESAIRGLEKFMKDYETKSMEALLDEWEKSAEKYVFSDEFSKISGYIPFTGGGFGDTGKSVKPEDRIKSIFKMYEKNILEARTFGSKEARVASILLRNKQAQILCDFEKVAEMAPNRIVSSEILDILDKLKNYIV